MNQQLSLERRVQRCVKHASDGNAIILLVTQDEVDRTQAMVGEAPVIVLPCGPKCQEFMLWWAGQMREQSGRGRKRRR